MYSVFSVLFETSVYCTMQVYEIAIIAAALNTLINYTIGKPSFEFSPYEIFSNYTVWLSIRRLQKVHLYKQYIQQYNENLNRTNEKHEVLQLKADFKKMLYNAADPFFTWERAVGMCPICTGFWVSLGTGLYFTKNIITLLIIVVVSHIAIRLISKYL